MSKTDLEVSLPSDREISMARSFDAPRQMIFKAYTAPELLKRWLVPFNSELAVCEIDLRVDGKLRLVWKMEGQPDLGLTSTFKEIVPPERLVATEIFDGGAESLSTLTFEERGGRTVMTNTILYDSKETRDFVLKTGMSTGVSDAYDKLETLLATMPAA